MCGRKRMASRSTSSRSTRRFTKSAKRRMFRRARILKLLLVRPGNQLVWDDDVRRQLSIQGSVKPADVPAGARLFVQTTSHNRKLGAGQAALILFPNAVPVGHGSSSSNNSAAVAAAAAASTGSKRKRETTADEEEDEEEEGVDVSAMRALKLAIFDIKAWFDVLNHSREYGYDLTDQRLFELAFDLMGRLLRTFRPPAGRAAVRATARRLGVSRLPKWLESLYLVHDGQDNIGEYVFGLLPGVITARWLPLDQLVLAKDAAGLAKTDWPANVLLVGQNKGGGGCGVVLVNLDTGRVAHGQVFDGSFAPHWQHASIVDLVLEDVSEMIDLWVEHSVNWDDGCIE